MSTRRIGFLSLGPPKRRSPAPSTTGKIFSRSSSTRSCSISTCTSWKLAGTTMSPVGSCFSLQPPVHHVAVEYRRIVPGGIFEGRGHDVLGHAVQPVRQFAAAGRPPCGEPFVAPPAKQQGRGAQGLVERELVELWAVLDQADPAADPETFVTGRVLDHPVECDVVAHYDLSHFVLLGLCCRLAPPRRRGW